MSRIEGNTTSMYFYFSTSGEKNSHNDNAITENYLPQNSGPKIPSGGGI